MGFVEGVFGFVELSGGEGGTAVAAIVENVVFVEVVGLGFDHGGGLGVVAGIVGEDGVVGFAAGLVAAGEGGGEGGEGERECGRGFEIHFRGLQVRVRPEDRLAQILTECST